MIYIDIHFVTFMMSSDINFFTFMMPIDIHFVTFMMSSDINFVTFMMSSDINFLTFMLTPLLDGSLASNGRPLVRSNKHSRGDTVSASFGVFA